MRLFEINKTIIINKIPLVLEMLKVVNSSFFSGIKKNDM